MKESAAVEEKKKSDGFSLTCPIMLWKVQRAVWLKQKRH